MPQDPVAQSYERLGVVGKQQPIPRRIDGAVTFAGKKLPPAWGNRALAQQQNRGRGIDLSTFTLVPFYFYLTFVCTFIVQPSETALQATRSSVPSGSSGYAAPLTSPAVALSSSSYPVTTPQACASYVTVLYNHHTIVASTLMNHVILFRLMHLVKWCIVKDPVLFVLYRVTNGLLSKTQVLATIETAQAIGSSVSSGSSGYPAPLTSPAAALSSSSYPVTTPQACASYVAVLYNHHHRCLYTHEQCDSLSSDSFRQSASWQQQPQKKDLRWRLVGSTGACRLRRAMAYLERRARKMPHRQTRIPR